MNASQWVASSRDLLGCNAFDVVSRRSDWIAPFLNYNHIRLNSYFRVQSTSLKMENQDLNRLKVVLAEKKRTNKWLAEQLGKDQTTIFKWCTNAYQPDLASLMQIAKLLDVELADLVRFEEFKRNGTR